MCIAVALPLAVPAEENRLAGIFPEWIKTVALVAPASPGTSREKVDAAISLLKKAGKETVEFSGVMPNPTYAKVQEGAALARERQVDFILAVGGSVIDCCKVISAQAVLDEDIWELEYNKIAVCLRK